MGRVVIAGIAALAFLVACLGYGFAWVYDRDPEGGSQ